MSGQNTAIGNSPIPLGREQLTKSNELLNSPYHVGSGLFYLDQYLGRKAFFLREFMNFLKTRGQQSFETILEEKSNEKSGLVF